MINPLNCSMKIIPEMNWNWIILNLMTKDLENYLMTNLDYCSKINLSCYSINRRCLMTISPNYWTIIPGSKTMTNQRLTRNLKALNSTKKVPENCLMKVPGLMKNLAPNYLMKDLEMNWKIILVMNWSLILNCCLIIPGWTMSLSLHYCLKVLDLKNLKDQRCSMTIPDYWNLIAPGSKMINPKKNLIILGYSMMINLRKN
jgi:hypothetical protein